MPRYALYRGLKKKVGKNEKTQLAPLLYPGSVKEKSIKVLSKYEADKKSGPFLVENAKERRGARERFRQSSIAAGRKRMLLSLSAFRVVGGLEFGGRQEEGENERKNAKMGLEADIHAKIDRIYKRMPNFTGIFGMLRR